MELILSNRIYLQSIANLKNVEPKPCLATEICFCNKWYGIARRIHFYWCIPFLVTDRKHISIKATELIWRLPNQEKILRSLSHWTIDGILLFNILTILTGIIIVDKDGEFKPGVHHKILSDIRYRHMILRKPVVFNDIYAFTTRFEWIQITDSTGCAFNSALCNAHGRFPDKTQFRYNVMYWSM